MQTFPKTERLIGLETLFWDVQRQLRPLVPLSIAADEGGHPEAEDFALAARNANSELARLSDVAAALGSSAAEDDVNTAAALVAAAGAAAFLLTDEGADGVDPDYLPDYLLEVAEYRATVSIVARHALHAWRDGTVKEWVARWMAERTEQPIRVHEGEPSAAFVPISGPS